MEKKWNHIMEMCFSEFIDGKMFDDTSEALFQLARAAFAEGYRVGVISAQGQAHLQAMNPKAENRESNYPETVEQ